MATSQSFFPPFLLGQGYDIHRLVPGRPLMLGGVQVAHSMGSEAHSDGDVVLHALIDALLGARAKGDIGEHFPSSDAAFKEMPSRVMLARILPLVLSDGYAIANVDMTVFLERPKLSPYKQTIQSHVAALLALPVDRVSFKAKTAEKFPPVGSGDAVAASAGILLYRLTP